ncbi:glycosyltransferase family 4 protein [Dehalococcoidia bacterium]|nr:glycosyltransferase family 4 protein [Dehalococcoidia bacterium]
MPHLHDITDGTRLKSPHVCMVIPHFPPVVGGAETQAKALAIALSELGLQITVLTRRIRNAPATEWLSSHCQVKRLPGRNPISFISALALYISARGMRWNVVHFHTMDSPLLISGVLRRLYGKRIVAKVPRSGPTGALSSYMDNNMLKNLRWRYIRANVDSFIALNKESKQELVALGASDGKIQCIPNGVDSSLIYPLDNYQKGLLRRNFNIGENDFFGVCIGRLIPRKRFDWVIESWQNLATTHKKSNILVVIGDGPSLDDLRRQSESAATPCLVRFVGEVKHSTVLDYLGCADCFILPSDSEGMSNALLEAMAAGVVPITRGIPGNLDLIDDERNGIIANTQEDITFALNMLIENEEKQRNMGKNARATIEQSYSINEVAIQYKELYLRLTERQ